MITEPGKEEICILPELAEGRELHLLLPNTGSSTSTKRVALTCMIVKAFRPFTISPVLLVSLVQPSTTPLHDGISISLPPIVVLKLYDRRCLSNIRDQWDERRPWSLDKEHEYRRYLDDIDAATGAAIARGDKFDDVGFLWDNDVSDGEFEAYLEHTAQRVFNAERATYERLRPLQGKKIPTLYGAVEYEISIPDGSAATETVPGLLLEYIPSLTLRELIATWTARDPPLPNGILATVCEEAVRVVERVSDFDVLNEDVRVDNFLIREPFVGTSSSRGEVPAVVEDAVVLIDLGHCRLRREDESEGELVKAKWSQDEAGAAGFVALGLVRKFVGEDVWTYKESLRYYRPRDLEEEA
ncbi:hypothetical protein LXA43DRAFT_951217 [Ganoderma leucocontextum]|nr:hypothetical protein LXA43DRAFT_951217 [Ganoderma leucocontextum]